MLKLVIATAPTIEPISLDELKLHLRLDSGSFADNVTETQSLIPDAYVVADNYTTHIGTGVDVLGTTTIVYLNSGTNGATGTVDVKIQESDNNVAFTDWATGAFTQVTTVNDNAVQEKAYTGTKQYVRTVAKVLLATCEFSTTVLTRAAETADDDLLTALIEAARLEVEEITSRALLTQTWDYYIDAWPADNYIKIPFGNLASVTHIKWTDSDGDETELTVTTDYLVELNGEACGKIVLPYGVTWPTGTLYTTHPIVIRFVAGWTTAAGIPENVRTAVKMLAANLYNNRGEDVVGTTVSREYKTARALLGRNFRLFDRFLS